MKAPEYEIWAADLNSLYDEAAAAPVFMEDCFSYDEAVNARNEYRTHDCAAWIQHKETGEIIA